MKVQSLFPTRIATGKLPHASALNRALRLDIREVSKQDSMGRQWCKENYPNGYTSYASLSDMHHRTPTFLDFASALQPFARKFARAQDWNLRGLELEMTACWINVMPPGARHGLHLHPHSVVSGVYYVDAPPGSVSLRLEDPRMAMYMNAPVREGDAGGLYHAIAPSEGSFVLFESWLRHEVPPNTSRKPRISISFNYDLATKS